MMGRMNTKGGLRIAILMAIVWTPLAGCNYGRMYDQDSIKTYEKKAETIDQRAVPITDGYDALALADPLSLKNPLSSSADTINQGLVVYGYYCSQCHGPKLDGNGRVGQSFSPLPTDLRSPAVLSQDDGVIYARIRLGYKRHPRLFSTVGPDDTWSIILYIRSGQQRPS